MSKNRWDEYERRKATIKAECLSPEEYQKRVAALVDELGV